MVNLLRRTPPPASARPELVRTLAVLLQAGARPVVAWRHVAEGGDADAQAVVAASETGQALPDAIRARGVGWAEVSAAWGIAATVGAPLGDVLRGIADALQDAEATSDDVRIALAEPASTARLMLWLPLVGVLLGIALGFDTLAVLTTSPLGIACLVAGVLLTALARIWTSALVRRAQPAPGIPGMDAELLAVALTGGASIARARQLVADEQLGDAVDGAGCERVLRLSQAAGVPAVELLRAHAAESRRSARVHGRVAAARLGSRLLLPLGACTLPAFLLLGVAPLILSVFLSTPLPLGP